VDGVAAVGGDLHRRILRIDVGQRVERTEQHHHNDDEVLETAVFEHRGAPRAARPRGGRRLQSVMASAQADFSVPLGRTLAIAPFCTRMRTLSAISTLTKCSPISRTTPATPPLVITSSPLPSFSSMARCSFCRFICGRIIRKYMIAIRMIGNSRPPRPPPNRPPGAWPAAWAIAGGTNRSIGFIW